MQCLIYLFAIFVIMKKGPLKLNTQCLLKVICEKLRELFIVDGEKFIMPQDRAIEDSIVNHKSLKKFKFNVNAVVGYHKTQDRDQRRV